MNKIKVDKEIYLDQVRDKDIPNLVRYLGNKKVSDNLLIVPYPYSSRDAKAWVDFVAAKKLKDNQLSSWAIYHKDFGLVGGISFFLQTGINGPTDEIGYWLGEPFWGQGIMSKVIRIACHYIGTMRPLKSIYATIFDYNEASGRVLEKAGFTFVRIVKNAFQKDGIQLNAKRYELQMKTTEVPNSGG